MSFRSAAASSVAVAVALASEATAGVLYSNNFDAQALGQINGQSAGVPGFPLIAWAANGDASVINGSTGPQPFSGRSLLMRATAAANTNRSTSFLAETPWLSRPSGEDTVACSIVMRVGAGQENQTASFGCNAVAAGGGAGLGFRVSAADGSISVVRGETLTATGASVTLGAWNSFTILWNTVTESTALVVNGDVVFSGVTTVTGDFRRFTMVASSGTAGGGGTAMFDNYSISSIPTPGAAIAMLIGIPAAAGRRRSR
jgi:hypothetical protein